VTGLYEQNPHALWARCDKQGLPLGSILTGGEATACTAAEPLMELPVAARKAPLADKVMMATASGKAC